MTLIRILIVSLVGTGLLASNASGQGVHASLCAMGSAVTYVAHLQVAAGRPMDSPVVEASILFSIDCPTSVIDAFKHLEPYDTETPQRWREAVNAAARDSSNFDIRVLLGVAMRRVAAAHDRRLTAYTQGMFDVVKGAPAPDNRALQAAVDRVVLQMLEEHGKCEGDVCGAVSDNLVSFLGSHATAVFKAMRADSVEAKNWLRVVADQSFAGVEDGRLHAEAARRAVIENLEKTSPDGFARERRECLETLRAIRYRAYR